jgi:hypothetical protein
LSRVAISDASPLILLSRTGYLEFLGLLDSPVQVPAAVADEIRDKGEQDITAPKQVPGACQLFIAQRFSERHPRMAHAWRLAGCVVDSTW